jgi:quercetin dioxygenase-like cupin family protein
MTTAATNTNSDATVHLASGEGRVHSMIDGDHVAKATVADDEGSFELFEVIAPAKPMAPPHVSPWSAVLYLLEGRLDVLVGDTTYAVEPGGTVVCPAGTPVSFEVVGEPARLLAITSGNRAGQFFADLAGSVPADKPVTESLDAILSVTQRHGVRLAGG